ncbi:hypothetical protein BKA70DRAFT_1234314 [Coprinopsis sp. MPI-PUGE-AT-0042]|nr:hypothetical protein BKA70DRAFT_1234314 [Coprinopsis sp. MPI-PUGE-AT-0042]
MLVLMMSDRLVRQEVQPHEWSPSRLPFAKALTPGVFIPISVATAPRSPGSDYHAANLGSYDPNIAFARDEDGENTNQQGVAFVTSNRIASVRAEFVRTESSTGLQRVEGALAELAKVDSDYSDCPYSNAPD